MREENDSKCKNRPLSFLLQNQCATATAECVHTLPFKQLFLLCLQRLFREEFHMLNFNLNLLTLILVTLHFDKWLTDLK